MTEVSGRGVGMDVVNDRIHALKGCLDIGSTTFAGSSFTLHVPVSSGVAHALVVQCVQESVALSTDQVVLPAGQAELIRNGEQLMLVHDGRQYRAFVLSQWLGFEEPATLGLAEAALRLPVLVKGAEGTITFLVDAVIDLRD